VERGRLKVGRRSGSFWWREIARIRDGVGGVEEWWFGEGVTQKVGMSWIHFSGPIFGWMEFSYVKGSGTFFFG
jgi:hypothetical protein